MVILKFYKVLQLSFILSFILSTNVIQASDYIEYIQGDYPLILEVPHDGTLKMESVSVRVKTDSTKNFNTGRDSYTSDLARLIADNIQKTTRKRPYVIIMKLSRKWIDVNREKDNAYDQPEVAEIYNDYFELLNKAKQEIIFKFKKGFLLDIHCGQSWTYDVYFGASSKNRSVKNLNEQYGKEAYTGENSIQWSLSNAGYEIPGYNDIPAKAGPVGKVVKAMTWGSEDKKLDGIEIEINLKKLLKNTETRNKLAIDLSTALQKFISAYYLH